MIEEHCKLTDTSVREVNVSKLMFDEFEARKLGNAAFIYSKACFDTFGLYHSYEKLRRKLQIEDESTK